MKPIIAALLFCMLSFTPEAQELNKTISKLNFEEAVTIDNIKIKLVKIISDSRCPKNVSLPQPFEDLDFGFQKNLRTKVYVAYPIMRITNMVCMV